MNAVHFSPSARTAWHSHALGQTLYVTEGRGLVQSRGDDAVEISPGDVIHTPDGEEHWHGATPDHFMTHLSLTEGTATWGDQVSDSEYRGRDGPPVKRSLRTCSRTWWHRFDIAAAARPCVEPLELRQRSCSLPPSGRHQPWSPPA